MAKHVKMTFWRDDYNGPACLEYSWVPEGLRRTILLAPGKQEGTNVDTIPDDLDPSHVQVYRLNNQDAVSTEMWQFPVGPPGPYPIAEAKVDVFQARFVAVGVVYYVGGTSAADARVLDPFPRPCPEKNPG